MARIIVVEDDLAQQEELLSFLIFSGHDATGADSGAALERCLQQFTPEIVLLDYNLPDAGGLELAERLHRQFGMSIGIVMVTARSSAVDRIGCRRAGADDYLVKPVDFREMLAIIDNLLLRIRPPATDAWAVYVTRAQLVAPDGATIHLAAFEIAILTVLAKYEHHLTSRDSLILALGKNPHVYDPRALEAIISRLRRKLPDMECGRKPLQAVRGIGYRFLRPLIIK